MIYLFFAITLAFLVYQGKRYDALHVLHRFVTTVLVFFGAFLFLGALLFALESVQVEVKSDWVRETLLAPCILLALILRHYWSRYFLGNQRS